MVRTTFGPNPDANLTHEEDISHRLVPSAWFCTALDNQTEEEVFDVVRTAAN